jgi:hypothetical protein
MPVTYTYTQDPTSHGRACSPEEACGDDLPLADLHLQVARDALATEAVPAGQAVGGRRGRVLPTDLTKDHRVGLPRSRSATASDQHTIPNLGDQMMIVTHLRDDLDQVK